MSDLVEIAQLGIEAERFKTSAIGKYLIDKARDEAIDASEKLCIINCTDSKAIEDLQNKVYRANSLITWIDAAIEDGEFVIQEMRDDQ